MTEDSATYITKSKLKAYFKDSCYTGGMDPNKDKNFYTVFDALFRRLDHEEEQEEEVG